MTWINKENRPRLEPSLLEKDKWGNWVVNKQYNPAMLTEAICKLEGFTYAPSDVIDWRHGHSSERDFIYVTTQNLKWIHLLMRDHIVKWVTPGPMFEKPSSKSFGRLRAGSARKR